MEHLPFTVFDMIVLIIVVVSLAVAVLRGFVSEVLSLFAWGGTFFATLYGFPPLRPLVRAHIRPDALADTVLFLTLAILTLIIFKLAANYIGKRVRQSQIGPLDRTLGVLFGLFRGLLVVCIAYIAISWIIPRNNQPGWIAEARTRPLVEYGSGFIRRLLPAEFAKYLAPFGSNEEIKDILKDMKPVASSEKNSRKGKGYDKKSRENLNQLIKEN
jgi:membrane protein required for colicin V production